MAKLYQNIFMLILFIDTCYGMTYMQHLTHIAPNRVPSWHQAQLSIKLSEYWYCRSTHICSAVHKVYIELGTSRHRSAVKPLPRAKILINLYVPDHPQGALAVTPQKNCSNIFDFLWIPLQTIKKAELKNKPNIFLFSLVSTFLMEFFFW